MALQIIIYEDENYKNFYPLTNFRPTSVLRAGILPLYGRIKKYFPNADLFLTCRSNLTPMVVKEVSDIPVNIIKKNSDKFLLLNGRLRDFGDLRANIEKTKASTIFYNNDEAVAIYLNPDITSQLPPIADINIIADLINDRKEEIIDFHTTATLYNYNWEIMADIEKEICADFEFFKDKMVTPANVRVHDSATLLGLENIYLGEGVEIMPGAVVDATDGPVYIDAFTKVESFAALYGPLYIGPNSLILQGKISSSSIGHTCRVGGEVEWSVFQSYVNKYHAGFVGHSYVGSWVNFGAMTTNSDLKNNYGNIRTRLNGKGVDTKSPKVGSFIGDHTKFGIGTLLNTGINIGVCCNIFGGTLVTDKEVKPFSWGMTGAYHKNQVDKVIESARIVYSRRNVEMSDIESKIIEAAADDSINDDGILKLSF